MQHTATTSGPVEKRPDPSSPAPIEDRVVRGREAETMTGLVDMQRRRLEEQNLFPKRFKLNPDGGPRGSYGYSRNEILQWIEERLASRAPPAT
jgi:predicted DNA-binding transcriptional regulator AlpA